MVVFIKSQWKFNSKSTASLPQIYIIIKIYLIWFSFSGFAIKCYENGKPPTCKDCKPERFTEKETSSCDSGMSMIGPNIGDPKLLICGPPLGADEVDICKQKDGNTICTCATDLCNKSSESSAGKFVPYLSLITFAIFISM